MDNEELYQAISHSIRFVRGAKISANSLGMTPADSVEAGLLAFALDLSFSLERIDPHFNRDKFLEDCRR